MTGAGPYRLWSGAFWRAYWVTLRPYLSFVSGVSGLVGLALAPGLSPAELTAAALAFLLMYGFGQALTDVFQTDTDALSSPYRPLTQGLISGRQVLGVSLLGLLGCAVVVAALNPWALVPAALAAVGLLTYTPFKRRFWGGPFWNSWIVALLPLMAFLMGRPAAFGVEIRWLLFAGMISVFFSYAIFVLLGYHKDISADRATGYRTIPVVFGWVPSVVTSGVFFLAAAAASAVFVWRGGLFARALGGEVLIAWVAWGLGLVFLAGAHLAMLRTRQERESHLAIALVVRGYVLLHLGEAAALDARLAWWAPPAYALFELALLTRPEKTQI